MTLDAIHITHARMAPSRQSGIESRDDGLNPGRIEIEPQQAPGPSHRGGGGFESCSSSPVRPPYGTAECFLEALLPPAILNGYLVRTGVTVS